MGKELNTGERFGRLVIVKRADDYIRPSDKKHRARYLCLCDCGNYKTVLKTNLVKGKTYSCGCWQREKVTKHNETRKTKLYTCWKNIRERCNNPNSNSYKYYGGKGIIVCDEWDEYTAFRDWALANGYKEGLTIDRIDVNKGYSPNNCRWVDMVEQANNKTNNHFISWNGETKTIAEWGKIMNISQSALSRRLQRGWSIERALTEPVIIGKNQYFDKDCKNESIVG